MRPPGEVMDRLALNVHAGNKNHVGPGEILRLDRVNIFINKPDFPILRDQFGDQQNPLRRHEPLDPDERKSMVKSAEAVAVFGESAENAPPATRLKTQNIGNVSF